jgi:hypothetical protein
VFASHHDKLINSQRIRGRDILGHRQHSCLLGLKIQYVCMYVYQVLLFV